jgi:hypothetical protein
MLETSHERVKLLKAGFNSKTIEKMYIEGNNIKLVKTPIIIDLVEFDISQNNEPIIIEAMAEYAQ